MWRWQVGSEPVFLRSFVSRSDPVASVLSVPSDLSVPSASEIETQAEARAARRREGGAGE
jgi:hypothetical protein